MGQAARQASRKLAGLTSTQKNDALHAIADALEARGPEVLAQNELDIAGGRANGLSDALLDRLLLTPERIRGLADDTRQVAALPDPVGAELESRLLPNGLRLSRRRIPIGVLGVIYEARPNTTIDIAVLSLKTGNAVILRGGKETLRSNLALVSVIGDALQAQGLPSEAVQYIGNPDRALVSQFLRMDNYVDMLIPRGGNSLHRLCREQSTIPVITGGIGICHYYVDISAEQERGMDVIVNARTQRPSVCNSLDTLLVNRQIAPEFLPKLARRMAECGVEMRATPRCNAISHRPRRNSHPGGAGRLGHGVDGADPGRQAGGLARRRHRSHSRAQPGPLRRNPHPGLEQCPTLCRCRQLLSGFRQRQHPLQRRWPIWPRCRGRHQHAETPCARAYGAGGVDHIQVDCAGRYARARIASRRSVYRAQTGDAQPRSSPPSASYGSTVSA